MDCALRFLFVIIALLLATSQHVSSFAQTGTVSDYGMESPKHEEENGTVIRELPTYTEFQEVLTEADDYVYSLGNFIFYSKLIGSWNLEKGDMIAIECPNAVPDRSPICFFLSTFEGELLNEDKYDEYWWVHDNQTWKYIEIIGFSGKCYMYLLATNSNCMEHCQSFPFSVRHYGKIDNLEILNPKNVSFGKLDGKDQILNKLLMLDVTAKDAYGNEIPICNIKPCQWELDIETGTATFFPILYPFFKEGALEEGHEFTLDDAIQVETSSSVNKTLRLWAGNDDETPSSLSSPDAPSASPEYLDLSGRTIGGCPTTPGVYIERRGTETRKVVVR